MKTETVEIDRFKEESRHPIHRRKMSKNLSIVNGAGENLKYASEDESIVRQINLAAAFHDHLSCTKSAELCKIDGTREARVCLPCETDHIYANCGDIKNNRSPTPIASSQTRTKEWTAEHKRLQSVLLIQLELIKLLEEEIFVKDRRIMNYKQESDSLKARLERRDRMCLLRNSHKPGEESPKNNKLLVKITEPAVNNATSITSTQDVAVAVASTTSSFPSPVTHEYTCSIPSVNLVTRYFGRRSKTIPSRALKRRYLGPPKTVPSKSPTPTNLSSALSASSGSEVHEDEMLPKTEIIKDSKLTGAKTDLKKYSKRGRSKKRPKRITRDMNYLTTDRPYFLPDIQTVQSAHVGSETLIDVPLWKSKPVTSFYQMEGTENINDPVFHRRHLKFEMDERRRKRWDIQRLREQKAKEKLKYKYSRDAAKDFENNIPKKSVSFYPDPRQIQYIEVQDKLPVSAFGHLIPIFQPSEFSISWNFDESQDMEHVHSPLKVAKKSRLSSAGLKTT